MDSRLGGSVMYLYVGPNQTLDHRRHTVVHEAIHGVPDPNYRIPTMYGDSAITEIGLGVDKSASYCRGRRGLR